MRKLMVVHDNPYTGEKVCQLMSSHDVDRAIRTLEGQGAKVGCWDMEYWGRMRKSVMSGNYKLS